MARRRTDSLRDRVALILAGCTGAAVLLLTAAPVFVPERMIITTEYAALLTGTLGVMVGALAGYIGGRFTEAEPDGVPDEAPREWQAPPQAPGPAIPADPDHPDTDALWRDDPRRDHGPTGYP